MGTYIKTLQKFDKSLKIKKKGPTVTIAGLSGSGKSTVAEAIAKELKLKIVSAGDIIRQMAKERKMKLEEFAKVVGPEADYELDRRSIKLAKEGNIVLVGRLAAYAAGDYADLKIFVDCPIEIRAQRVAKRENKSTAKAKNDIIKRDTRDAKRYWKIYHIDDADKRIYDVIINNGYLGKKEIEALSAGIARFLIRR